MNDQSSREQECEKIAAEETDEVCRRFVNDEEIHLNLTIPIKPGPVRGLQKREALHDEYRTVILTYSIIPRSDIVLDRNRLYAAALKEALNTARHPDVMKITDDTEYRSRISEWTQWGIGRDLEYIFSEFACANPEKYPTCQSHGHAYPVKLEPISSESEFYDITD